MTGPAFPGPGDIFTGAGYVNVIDPDPATFALPDIFTALSRVVRFGGHGRFPYTVGQHVLTCLRIAALWGEPFNVLRAVLMHDAAEAYLGDVPTPIKAILPDYRALEARMEAAIFDRFDVGLPLYAARVKRVDLAALSVEKAALHPTAGPWGCDVDVSDLPRDMLAYHDPKTGGPYHPRAVAHALAAWAHDLGVE